MQDGGAEAQELARNGQGCRHYPLPRRSPYHITLYAWPSLRPLNRHRVLNDNGGKHAAGVVSKNQWIMGTFLMFLACIA
jgi:hypothetical protein